MLTLGQQLAELTGMAKRPSGEFDTVKILRSFAAARPDGRYAIVLVTQSRTIALEGLDSAGIANLRKSLDALELFQRQTPGTA